MSPDTVPSVAVRLRRSVALLSPDAPMASPTEPSPARLPALFHTAPPMDAIPTLLPAPSELPRTVYVASVATSACKSAGTDRHVYLAITGDLAHTDYILLRDPVSHDASNSDPSTFPAGSVRTFRFDATYVGNITKISVRHDPQQAPTAAWRPDRFLITDHTLHRTWSFLSPTWLNRDTGNHIDLKPQPEVYVGQRATRRATRRLIPSKPRLSSTASPLPSPLSASFNNIRNKFMDDNERVVSQGNESGTRRVCFQLHKFTNPAAHVYLLGGSAALGHWNPQRAIRMTMHSAADGTWRGEWRLEVEIDDDFADVQYTYMIINSSASHDRRRVILPDRVRTLRLNSPDLLERAAEGSRIYVKDVFGNNEFTTSSARSPVSVPRRAFSRLSSRSHLADSPFSPVMALRRASSLHYRPNSLPINVVPTNLSPAFYRSSMSNGPHATFPSCDFPTRIRLSEDFTNHNFLPTTPAESHTSDANDAALGPLALPSPQQQTDEAQREEPSQELNSTDGHLARSPERLRCRHSDADYLTSTHSPTLTKSSLPRLPSPHMPDEISPVSSDGLSESENASTDPTVEDIVPPDHNASKSFTVGDGRLMEQIRALKREKEKESSARENALVCITSVKQELKKVRDAMTERSEEFSLQQAEVVRLLMDSKEAHIAAQAKLASERDIIMGRWEQEFKLRRKLFNQVQELRGNIRVFCRVRPLKQVALTDGSPASLAVDFPDGEMGDSGSVSINAKSFEFDHAFHPQATQEEVYRETSGVVASVIDGYNVCVFAYGQTGSGKTHTMNGPPSDRGVNFQALMELFQIAEDRAEHSKVSITVSMLEIYNETLRDLIRPDSAGDSAKLEIRRDPNSTSANAVYVPNLSEIVVHTVQDVWDLMHQGASNRSMGKTNMNEHSSRSHLILKVKVICEKYSDGYKSSGVLHLVDLAGSERVGRSQASGERLKEAQYINKSLSTLGDVFTALNNHSSHIPYRNSRLTYLLQDCLGGDSKTLMFVNIAADEADANESVSSLQFAQRVAKVELKGVSRHMERTGEAKAIASLHAKENETQSLRSNLSAVQRELRKKEEGIFELSQKTKSLESALRTTKKVLEERKKENTSGRSGAVRQLKEVRALQEKAESSSRNATHRARTAADLVISKDEEMKRLREQLKAKELIIAEKEQAILELSSISLEPPATPLALVKTHSGNTPSGILSKPDGTPMPSVAHRGSATFAGRNKHVRFNEIRSNTGSKGKSDLPPATPRRLPGTPAPIARRATLSSVVRTQSMHTPRPQRQGVARVPFSSSTGRRMSYGYGTRAEPSSTATPQIQTPKPLRNARLPRARTIFSRPPQRVTQPGVVKTPSSARPNQNTSAIAAKSALAASLPRRVGSATPGINRTASGRLPPRPNSNPTA